MSEQNFRDWPPAGASDDVPAYPTLDPQPALTTLDTVPPAQPSPENSRSRARLLITLAVIGALLVLGGGAAGVFALVQYGQPGAAAGQFCQDLKAQNFDTAYTLLSPALADRYSRDQFHQLNEALDSVEGNVTACGTPSGSGVYNYTLGSSTATVGAVISRGKQGNLQGRLHLIDNNGWKIDAIDTSVLGVNPGALQTLSAFCTALQTQDYATLYSLLGGTLRGQSTKDEFVITASLDDLLDGKVTACSIVSLAKGNTDTTTTATVSVTRSTLGKASGSVSLASSDGTWTLVQADAGILGRDLQPLLVGTAFCLNIAIGDFTAAYGLESTTLQQSMTQAQLTRTFTLPAGDKWLLCSPDITTYQVSSTAAQYSGTFEYANASNAFSDVAIRFTFTKEGGDWKIASVTLGHS
ncbi:MAG TPA: hypothetical protein VF120_05340 [Ktedonobacterales bacterium]